MKATRHEAQRPPYLPVDLTLETEEEYKDLRWLVAHTVTIPNALSGASLADHPEQRRARAAHIIEQIAQALDRVGGAPLWMSSP